MATQTGNLLKWAGLGLGIAWLARTCAQKAMAQRETEVDRRRPWVSTEETIFVSMLAIHDVHAVQTLLTLFDKAYAPHRIFVGVYQLVKPGDPDIMVLYETSATHDFSDNIRVFSVEENSSSQIPPLNSARSIIEKHLYRNEKYWLQVDSHVTEWASNWDETFLEQLGQCSQVPKPILTCCLPREDLGELPSKSPNFTRFRGFQGPKGDMPVFEGAPFIKRPLVPVPALAYTEDCVFGYAMPRFQEVPNQWPEYEMGQILYGYGYDFFHPSLHILKRSGAAPSLALSGSSAALPPMPYRSPAAYERWCGVRKLPTPLAAPTAYGGLNIVQAETEQILAKYGGQKAYRNHLLGRHWLVAASS